MPAPPSTLLEALTTTDMLEIDDLYAWEFSLVEAIADAQAIALRIECIDGRTRRNWAFPLAAVQAATFDPEGDTWCISDSQGAHRLRCLSAFVAGNDDEEDIETASE
jgi:hypothetical protein